MDDLQAVWTSLFAQGEADPRDVEASWQAIASAYAQPWRHYHTLDHIRSLLTLRQTYAARFRDPVTVDLAIVLHDVVYDPQRRDNEARSADWARACLPVLGTDAARAAEVARLIALSRHDPAELAGLQPDGDPALFLDLDLSVLAADAGTYATYAQAVRREYAVYPDILYRPGRAKVLRSFLDRSSIYSSAHLRAAWEDRARMNLAGELEALTT